MNIARSCAFHPGSAELWLSCCAGAVSVLPVRWFSRTVSRALLEEANVEMRLMDSHYLEHNASPN